MAAKPVVPGTAVKVEGGIVIGPQVLGHAAQPVLVMGPEHAKTVAAMGTSPLTTNAEGVPQAFRGQVLTQDQVEAFGAQFGMAYEEARQAVIDRGGQVSE